MLVMVTERQPDFVVVLGDVTINFTTHETHQQGEEIEFTPLELDILHYLASRPGETVSRQALLRDLWGLPRGIVTRTVDRHIASIRRKISRHTDDRGFIQTEIGKGYRLVDMEYPTGPPRAPTR